ncbi:glycosyltransferase family 4 protein [Corynebacterium sp. ES2715-CONJ3]|uniref:glycosyltransferase family 4 protein n=1 Tax=Corynebacterium sp. ES2715-CONJ3 TaxID=2974028 RepID=UPI00216781CD|nr:glycosyltransferase family 4 protein [Corynebacterium sp. ES2715-CONJ3]MCS4491031.1 glycosyltransferase family 4 protein [Corynebacterium sp. ES2715-CONJ3]
MRIGFVCPYSFDHLGGVQAHILDLAEVFRRQGHDVAVLGPSTRPDTLPDFVHPGGPSIPIKYNGSVARLSIGPKTFAHARDFIEQGEFDVLHIHEPNSPSYSLVSLSIAHGPIVATYHASAANSRLLRLVQPILRPHLEKIRGGIAVSEMARRWQVEQLGGDPVLIPNGVHTEFFRRSEIKTSSQKVEIAFLGRIDEPRKGLDILLEAFQGLEECAHLTVMGDGSVRPQPGVSFAGRVSEEDKARILGAADIYVAPNTGGESFGIVLVEAMAAGCAVVASDLEAFAAVSDAHSAVPAARLFKTGDPASLHHALKELIANPLEREKLRQAGRSRATDFEWKNIADQIMRVYETVCDGTKVTVESQ